MTTSFEESLYRRRWDVEAGSIDTDDDESSPFDILSTENAPVDRLRRWRQAALVLNASRRFRYTLDLKKEEEKEQVLRKIRAHAQAIRISMMAGPAEHHGIGMLELELEDAAIRGDCKKAEKLFRERANEITPSRRLNEDGETALHMATRHNNIGFVENLVGMMSPEELVIETGYGETAFAISVRLGRVECAMTMLKKKPDLAITPIRFRHSCYLPIQVADILKHNNMLRCLNQVRTRNMAEIDDRTSMLLTSIDNGNYGTAKFMLSNWPELATRENIRGETPLSAIARKISVSRTRKTFQDLERNGLMTEFLKHANGRAYLSKELFKAAEEGDSGFVTEAIRSYPDLAIELDEQNRTLFHVAVQHRRINVFKIKPGYNSSIILWTDTGGNDTLHLAAKLPLNGLELVPGAGVELVAKLQHEKLFFEEVKKVVGRQHMDPKTEKSYVLLFDKEHEDLRRKAEEWLTKIANIGMIFAGYVFSVGIAAIFIEPGSYEKDTSGVPVNLIGISNAATFSLSLASLISFLSIHTSNFSTRNIVESLPSRLLFGLSTLCLSIPALMGAFADAFFIHFKNLSPRLCYSVSSGAFLLIALASYHHLPFLFQVFLSASMPSHPRLSNTECFDVPNFRTTISRFWRKIQARIFRNR